MSKKLDHPRRPRGSQSGREKGRDESFHVRAKEPLGTDSHRTISKNSSGCQFLIGHKKRLCIIVPNRRTVSPEFFSWVRTRRLLPGSFIKLVRTRETSIFYFPNQKRRNYWWEYSVFDSSQCIVNNSKLKMRRRWESQISNSFTRQNNNFARASHFFVHFFAVNCTTTRENA